MTQVSNYTYLMVGGGMAAAAAIAGIREIDDAGAIGVITSEPHPPYDRPPLSKRLWRKEPLDSIWRQGNMATVTLHEGRTARSLDVQSKQVIDDHGDVYRFDKLLLATGSRPRRLPVDGDGVIYYRTLDDYERVRQVAAQRGTFVIIGAGFIGSEMAAALAMNGAPVTLVFPDEAIGSQLYPSHLAQAVNALFRAKGVDLVPRTHAIACESRNGKQILTVRGIDSGGERSIIADGVIAGIGVEPNVELARAAGLEVNDGIRVDASLRTSHPDIFAAGDVAAIHNASLEAWRRVEHADNANSTGGYAGVAMAGRTVRYEYLPFFYSDFFEVGYEAVGDVDARLDMVEEWRIPNVEGTVTYLRDGQVRGALYWNVYGSLGTGRHAIGLVIK